MKQFGIEKSVPNLLINETYTKAKSDNKSESLSEYGSWCGFVITILGYSILVFQCAYLVYEMNSGVNDKISSIQVLRDIDDK